MKDYSLLVAAAALLVDDNLVWSDDFEQIKSNLANLLLSQADNIAILGNEASPSALRLAEQLLKDENELA